MLLGFAVVMLVLTVQIMAEPATGLFPNLEAAAPLIAGATTFGLLLSAVRLLRVGVGLWKRRR
jgi:hypothetical protein